MSGVYAMQRLSKHAEVQVWGQPSSFRRAHRSRRSRENLELDQTTLNHNILVQHPETLAQIKPTNFHGLPFDAGLAQRDPNPLVVIQFCQYRQISTSFTPCSLPLV